jgi:hypothetical protein
MGRVSGVLGIIIASLTVVTPVFHKLSAGEPTAREIDDEIVELKVKIELLEKKKLALESVSEVRSQSELPQ